MKFQEALYIINKKEKGFMVAFTKVCEDGTLIDDHFPDKHAEEALIPTEGESWDLAQSFAKATGNNFCNIYVIDNNFFPVNAYEAKILKQRLF